jgi:hypothetical protein
MEISKEYKRVKFSQDILEKAINKFEEVIQKQAKSKRETVASLDLVAVSSNSYRATLNEESWVYDSDIEFYEDYRKSDITYASIHIKREKCSFQMRYHKDSILGIETSISISGKKRENIFSVFKIFEKAVQSCRIPKTPNSPLPIWEY